MLKTHFFLTISLKLPNKLKENFGNTCLSWMQKVSYSLIAGIVNFCAFFIVYTNPCYIAGYFCSL